jgi:hypothetical protein
MNHERDPRSLVKAITSEQALQRLRDPDVEHDGGSYSKLDLPWELSANDFLTFADADLGTQSDSRALVNALSNAKRALHCQVDSIFFALGLYRATRSQRFPQKLELLSRLGVVTRRALDRLNESRNVMEHEYVTPAENEVRLFCDVVAFFIEATDWYIGLHEWEFEASEGGVIVEIKPEEEKITLNRQVDLAATNDDYIEILCVAIPLARS